MLKSRIEWLDIAKGIAIILVVIGHSPATNGMKTFIYSFHIPLFFFLSGFVFNQQKYSKTKDFFENKIRTTITPYLLFSFIGYLIYVFWENGVYNTNFSALSIFKGVFYASASTLKINSVLWFLPCLFIVQTTFFIITKISYNRTYLTVILIAFSIVGYLYSKYNGIRLPWFIDSSLTATVFYGIGFIYKNYDSRLEEKISPYYTEVIIGSFAMVYLFSFLNTTVDMFSLVYNNYFYYYLSAVFGIVFCITLSKLIKYSNTLSYIGKNTILIFAFHTNMFVIINFILGYIRDTYNIQFTVTYLAKWSMLYTSLSVLLLIPIIITVKKCVRLIKNKQSITHGKRLEH